MARNPFLGRPEVFVPDPRERAAAARLAKAGTIRRIQRGLYTTNVADPLDAVVRRNLWRTVGLVAPGVVISHRTALNLQPTALGTIFVTAEYNRTFVLPGLRIRQLTGPGRLEGDTDFTNGLLLSSAGRAFLECLSGRPRTDETPYLAVSEVEARLERLLLQGEDRVNSIRDAARAVTAPLGAATAFDRLDRLIGALMATRQGSLATPAGRARAAGRPFDSARLELCESLLREMNGWATTVRPDPVDSGPKFQTIAFFDAYFSNYIEGAEFEVAEAIEIVFNNIIPRDRPEDAHDVLGTYAVVGSPTEMRRMISELRTDEFLDLVKSWHRLMLEGRPEKNPGRFKLQRNRAGNTLFVEPELVEGTLREAFPMIRGIRSPFGRAAFLMFLISEVHPFDDGNGRAARAVANAELIAHGERRLIVPTVFRVEYIDALRRLSREGEPRLLARMLDQAQEFCADIDFADLPTAIAQLHGWNAFEHDDAARLRRPARSINPQR